MMKPSDSVTYMQGAAFYVAFGLMQFVVPELMRAHYDTLREYYGLSLEDWDTHRDEIIQQLDYEEEQGGTK